mmetsp:Transcript_24426/g.61837  ORF Transcript_24426/g.61837 Transcript_24426/m.61837 type:complete len:302 (-) Transcript_24426:278-1183(-)
MTDKCVTQRLPFLVRAVVSAFAQSSAQAAARAMHEILEGAQRELVGPGAMRRRINWLTEKVQIYDVVYARNEGAMQIPPDTVMKLVRTAMAVTEKGFWNALTQFQEEHPSSTMLDVIAWMNSLAEREEMTTPLLAEPKRQSGGGAVPKNDNKNNVGKQPGGRVDPCIACLQPDHKLAKCENKAKLQRLFDSYSAGKIPDDVKKAFPRLHLTKKDGSFCLETLLKTVKGGKKNKKDDGSGEPPVPPAHEEKPPWEQTMQFGGAGLPWEKPKKPAARLSGGALPMQGDDDIVADGAPEPDDGK